MLECTVGQRNFSEVPEQSPRERPNARKKSPNRSNAGSRQVLSGLGCFRQYFYGQGHNNTTLCASYEGVPVIVLEKETLKGVIQTCPNPDNLIEYHMSEIPRCGIYKTQKNSTNFILFLTFLISEILEYFFGIQFGSMKFQSKKCLAL